MKTLSALFIMAFLFLAFITHRNAADYIIDNDFSITIKGSSNVHDWESTITQVSGTASIFFSEEGQIQIDDCTIKIPVKSIKSSKGRIMDNKTFKALKAKDYPTIEYRLTCLSDVIEKNNGFTAKTAGTLHVAGVSQTIDMDIMGRKGPDGRIEITGSKPLKMTDFNIDPPTALMGAMTTADDITIVFRVTLAP